MFVLLIFRFFGESMRKKLRCRQAFPPIFASNRLVWATSLSSSSFAFNTTPKSQHSVAPHLQPRARCFKVSGRHNTDRSRQEQVSQLTRSRTRREKKESQTSAPHFPYRVHIPPPTSLHPNTGLLVIDRTWYQ
jgi:hypothetical protein